MDILSWIHGYWWVFVWAYSEIYLGSNYSDVLLRVLPWFPATRNPKPHLLRHGSTLPGHLVSDRISLGPNTAQYASSMHRLWLTNKCTVAKFFSFTCNSKWILNKNPINSKHQLISTALPSLNPPNVSSDSVSTLQGRTSKEITWGQKIKHHGPRWIN